MPTIYCYPYVKVLIHVSLILSILYVLFLVSGSLMRKVLIIRCDINNSKEVFL